MPTKLLDGPAAGVVLELPRWPKFLRVAVGEGHCAQWRALAGLEDEPDAFDDHLYAYMKVADDAYRGGDGSDNAYTLYDPQPDDAVMRDTALWRRWCYEQQGKGFREE